MEIKYKYAIKCYFVDNVDSTECDPTFGSPNCSCKLKRQYIIHNVLSNKENVRYNVYNL